MKKLKNELLGTELTLMDLDNKMVEAGYYSIFDDGVLQEVLNDKNAIFLHSGDNETQLQVSFDVTILADENIEAIGASYIKITNVEKM